MRTRKKRRDTDLDVQNSPGANQYAIVSIVEDKNLNDNDDNLSVI